MPRFTASKSIPSIVLILGFLPASANATTWCFELEDPGSESPCLEVNPNYLISFDMVDEFPGMAGVNCWQCGDDCVDPDWECRLASFDFHRLIDFGDEVYLYGERSIYEGEPPLHILADGFDEESRVIWSGDVAGRIAHLIDEVPAEEPDQCLHEYSPLRVDANFTTIESMHLERRIEEQPSATEGCQSILTVVGVQGHHAELKNLEVNYSGDAWNFRGRGGVVYSGTDCIKFKGSACSDTVCQGDFGLIEDSLIYQCHEHGVDAVGEDYGTVRGNAFHSIYKQAVAIKGGSRAWSIHDNYFYKTFHSAILLGGECLEAFQENPSTHVDGAWVYNNIIVGRTDDLMPKQRGLGIRLSGTRQVHVLNNTLVNARLDLNSGEILHGESSTDLSNWHTAISNNILQNRTNLFCACAPADGYSCELAQDHDCFPREDRMIVMTADAYSTDPENTLTLTANVYHSSVDGKRFVFGTRVLHSLDEWVDQLEATYPFVDNVEAGSVLLSPLHPLFEFEDLPGEFRKDPRDVLHLRPDAVGLSLVDRGVPISVPLRGNGAPQPRLSAFGGDPVQGLPDPGAVEHFALRVMPPVPGIAGVRNTIRITGIYPSPRGENRRFVRLAVGTAAGSSPVDPDACDQIAWEFSDPPTLVRDVPLGSGVIEISMTEMVPAWMAGKALILQAVERSVPRRGACRISEPLTFRFPDR